MTVSFDRSIRSLLRRPVYAGLSIALLALGTGAVYAILTIVTTTLLQPLPYRQPERLVAVGTEAAVGRESMAPIPLAAVQLVRWREQAQTLAGLEGYTPVTLGLTGEGSPEPLPGAAVSAGLFDLLGVHPLLGRGFDREDEQPNSGKVIISYGLWMRRFGGRPEALGRSVVIDGLSRVIVGILPRDFTLFFQPGDVFVPLSLGAEDLAVTRLRMIAGVGRLGEGVTREQALADLNALNDGLAHEQPVAFENSRATVAELHEALFGAQRAGLLLLAGAVLLVLLIAAANVLNLALADVVNRRVATLTRLALGAGRGAILRDRLVDSALLTTVAVGLGLLVGWLILSGLQRVNPDAFATFGGIEPDPVGVALTVGIALATGILAALPAAWTEASLDISSIAAAVSRSVGSRAEGRAREGLIAVQMAITVILLAGATLLARNLRSLLTRSPGFDPHGVVAVQLPLSIATYPTPADRSAHVEQLLGAVRALPGVVSASTVQTRFVLNETMQTVFEVDGQPADPGVKNMANIRNVMPDLFSTLRIPLVEGRGIDATDQAGGRTVAVVSASLARRYWGSESAIGKRLRRTNRPDAPWMDVVGVVGDVSDAGLGVDIGPTLYVSYLQQNTPTARVTLVVRTTGKAEDLIPVLRRTVWGIDPGQVIGGIAPLEELLLQSAASPRFLALVVALFASSAFVLVISGIYALTLFGVLRRTRELGVRAALGALPSRLVGFTMWQSVRPMAMGLLAGIGGMVPLFYLLPQSFREGLGLADLPVVLAAIAVLVSSGGIAALVPALRATRISPTVAMRP